MVEPAGEDDDYYNNFIIYQSLGRKIFPQYAREYKKICQISLSLMKSFLLSIKNLILPNLLVKLHII